MFETEIKVYWRGCVMKDETGFPQSDSDTKGDMSSEAINDLKKEVDNLKKQVEANKNSENFFQKIKINRPHWVKVITFIEKSGLTYMTFMVSGLLLSGIGIQIFNIAIVVLLVIVSYFYPLLTNREQFIWEPRIKEAMMNASTHAKKYKNLVNDAVDKSSSLKNKKFQTRDSHITNVRNESSTHLMAMSFAKIVGMLLGVFNVFAFYNLPFIEIHIPIIGSKSTTLSSLLQSATHISSTLYMDSSSVEFVSFLLVAIPVVYVIVTIFSNSMCRILAIITSGANCILILVMLVKIMSQISQIMGNFSSTVDYNNVASYLGVGFWIVILTPFIMFVFSLIRINQNN